MQFGLAEARQTIQTVRRGIPELNHRDSVKVEEGVYCLSYEVSDSKEVDTAVIVVKPGHKTPKQKVIKGDKTAEQFLNGFGKITIWRVDSRVEFLEETYYLTPDTNLEVDLNVGDIMQWEAAEDSYLVFSEHCWPPYEEGRFENLEE